MSTASFTSSLADRIWETEQFQTDLAALHAASVLNGLPGATAPRTPSTDEGHRLLQSATVLADSSRADHRQAAYRIAVDAFSLYRDEFSNLPSVMHVILGKLGNFPAIDHLYRLLGTGKGYDIPSGALHALIHHEGLNTVKIGDGDIILTDFQQGLWSAMGSEKVVSVSAPTSAGKSFALQQYLIQALLSGEIRFVLYIVPTRALINQVSDAISSSTKGHAKDLLVSTIPQPPKDLGMECGVFVLTQERTHVLLESDRELRFDMVVVDEAQTLGEGARGILLQVVLEKLLRDNPQARFFFGSPFSRNPDIFQFLLGDKVTPLKEETSPVSQNLIFADVDPGHGRSVTLSLCADGASTPVALATVPLDHEVRGDEPTFAYISQLFGQDSKNLVYSGSPAKCEDIADKIRQWQADINGEPEEHEELQEFAAFARDHIHKDYQLARMIECGIAFHYGKMPTILRKAIEYYFVNSKHLRFLVCTSTLLHGVNLPAKNLFILKPSEGERWLTKNSQPMKSTSFWNLAGRAGRMGKDFEGNVFLVNKAEWAEDPTSGEKEQTITSALFSAIQQSHEDVIRVARNEDVEVDLRAKELIEGAFVKLYCDHRRGRLEEALAKSPVPLPKDFAQSFATACDELTFTVPDQIIEDNLTISPFRQQKMLDYIVESINAHDHDKLIPLHPESSGCYQSYVRLFSRFQKYFGGKPVANSKVSQRLAGVALAWMKGVPYPQMIKNDEKRYSNRALQTIIRQMMDTIENELRFSAVQNSRCYNDILSHALEANGLDDLLASIPAIPLYLEIGACSGTMVNLIGLGLSRTTAGLLNQKSANRGMDRGQCVSWLLREDWPSSGLPKICVNEVGTVLAGASRQGAS